MNAMRLKQQFIKRVRGREAAARALGVRIGSGCRILSDVATTEPWLISIGDRVTVSSRVVFITHDGSGWLYGDEKGRRYRYAPIEIGSDVFVGSGVTIMPGVRIGDRCVIGAGSVLTASVPSGSVVAGVPARYLKSWDEFAGSLGSWKSAEDMTGESYRERVDSISEQEFRPELPPIR